MESKTPRVKSCVASTPMSRMQENDALPPEFCTLSSMFAQTGMTPELLQQRLAESKDAIVKLANSRCEHMMQSPEQSDQSLTMNMTGATFVAFAAALRPPDMPMSLGPLLSKEDLRMNGYGKIDIDTTTGNTGAYLDWLISIGLKPATTRIAHVVGDRSIYGLTATLE